MKHYISLLIIFFSIQNIYAQEPTVGVLLNTNETFNGYTLFLGGQRNVYLINNCGQLINKWENTLPAGATAYLLPNGNIMRAVRLGQTTFQGGGIGGAVELLDWNNNVIWQFNYHESNSHHQHHDIEPLPNGNVLILAWEHRTGNEALANGRLVNRAIWPTQIVEVQPEGINDGKIVWEWHLWDHLIQDANDTLANFGNVSKHPELLDINVGIDGQPFPGAVGGIDWLHCNSVDYIEEHDWILISSKHLHEIYIIDHSTTSEEAATNTGGNYGKGGSFLYRWGNPVNYKRGTLQDKVLAGQHDAIWIPSTDTSKAQIMLVNNGKDGRVDVLTPPLTAEGKFAIGNTAPFGPANLTWYYEADIKSAIGCSARRLANGNTVYCDARTGLIEEVNLAKQKVWQYQNPVKGSGGPVEQGTPVNTGSFGGGFGSFRAEKYSVDYLTNANLDLSPKGKIELMPYTDSCSLVMDTMTVPIDSITIDTLTMPIDTISMDTITMPIDTMEMDTITMPIDSMFIDTLTMPIDTMEMDTIISVSNLLYPAIQLNVYPIPSNGLLYVDEKLLSFSTIEIFDLSGKICLSLPFSTTINIHHLQSGMYLLRLSGADVVIYKYIVRSDF